MTDRGQRANGNQRAQLNFYIEALEAAAPPADANDLNGEWRLLAAIEATGAERVLVTHGYVDTLVRFLREERGLDAAPLESRFEGEEGEAADEGTPAEADA